MYTFMTRTPTPKLICQNCIKNNVPRWVLKNLETLRIIRYPSNTHTRKR